jgi:alpha-glucosidase
MHGVLRFWLDRGVDGFRADVVHLIGKDPALPDIPETDIVGSHLDVVGTHDYQGTHAFLRGIRAVLNEYPGDRMMVGEVNLSKTELIAPYLGNSDELHLAFDFESLTVPWEAAAWRARIAHVEKVMGERWPTWVFSNHDQPRLRTRLGGSEARARAAVLMLLTLRGTPFLFAGEELGLEDAHVPPERVVDPGGRDGCRAPIPWTTAPDHGWPADPWLPWPPEPGARSVEAERADPHSMLHLARAVLALRRDSPALRRGGLDLLDDAPDGVLAYERSAGDDRRRVWVNFADAPAALPDGWVVQLATADTGDGLPPDAAAVLRPR